MEFSKETGRQAPEGPILCQQLWLFGQCSHHEHVLQVPQGHDLEAGTGKTHGVIYRKHCEWGSGSSGKEFAIAGASNVHAGAVELKVVPTSALWDSSSPNQTSEVKVKEGPNRCNTCRKRVGLTGFSCRCGNLFCADHRYSDKHECPFDYRTTAQDAIARANPVVKAEKLDKIQEPWLP